jgi:hypothetical protein
MNAEADDERHFDNHSKVLLWNRMRSAGFLRLRILHITKLEHVMQKEARLLRDKAIKSLLLSIDHFNGVSELGRFEAVLIFLDHSFEMLLKAAILKKGGKIRLPRQKETIGFEKCVRKALSETIFLSEEQALVLQTINGLRDAAQHHLLELSEGQLYFHAQSGVTLFRDILQDVFQEDIARVLPDRVLPISTMALTDPLTLFSSEAEEVRKLLAPGKRKRAEAAARLRGIAIVDGALQGTFVQPGETELKRLGQRLVKGETFHEVFPGIGSINFTTEGEGSKLSLRISKKEGIPVTIVPEGTPGSGVVAIKRVDELGYYNLGHHDLAKKVGLTTSKTTAAIALLGLKADCNCFKEFTIGKVRYQRYSQESIKKIKTLIDEKGADQIWSEYRTSRRTQKASA